MSCKPLKGVLRGESRLAGKLSSSRVLGPDGLYFDGQFSGVATGIYRQNIIQKNQFQDVLESLRLQHQPQHWASWALDGSLEEDREQFPLGMDGGWEWADVGSRKAVKFDGSASAGLMYGTDEDFQWAHETRIFTMGGWLMPTGEAVNDFLIATNAANRAAAPGFSLYRNYASVRPVLDIPSVEGLSRFSPNMMISGLTPLFYVMTGNGTGGIYRAFVNGAFIANISIYGNPIVGHSYDPLTIGWRSTATIWNAFATSAILTDAEIYRLYVAGLNDIQVF